MRRIRRSRRSGRMSKWGGNRGRQEWEAREEAGREAGRREAGARKVGAKRDHRGPPKRDHCGPPKRDHYRTPKRDRCDYSPGGCDNSPLLHNDLVRGVRQWSLPEKSRKTKK